MNQFREELDEHLRKYPFDLSLLDGKHSAYGMSLFIEKEFDGEFPKLAEKILNVSDFYCYTKGEPADKEIDFFVIWGVSPVDENASKILSYAQIKKKPILIIEDGFLRSFFPMSFGEVSASIRLDNKGCYYDSHHNSSILDLLNSADFELNESQKGECAEYISKIVNNSLTKYLSPKKPSLPDADNGKVLVIDQVYGDMSIVMGGADTSDFDNMLKDAISEHPDKEIIVKLHPESILGIRKGHYSVEELSSFGVTILSDNVNSIELLKEVDIVYCATTQMGFEALMCGKQVNVYGKPFYAGWGLTSDRKVFSNRKANRSLEELFYAAYLYQVIYFNPKKAKVTCLDDILNYFIVTSQDHDYLNGLKQKRFDLRLRHLEKKILEIESLKDTAVTLDKHVYQIKSNFAYIFGEKLERILVKINRRFSQNAR
ncbi:capsular polysaccharide export protein, LipB/KpsS family [Grimontia marina]|uniref:Capsule polysaccharide biosynthesis protein n=1 Tax=Grimontia marina TaxID=646534 RepID=A0A128ERY6_9GAMM|nr:beta-3-deoxy-D-manno-oct-2-ulosonic acid transferase [Grimontia marina]CZF77332.1 Capsule polysaccharide biosynthesis protein [Grimontia marina]